MITMNRRKFIAGMGATATGIGAAVGSGAFFSAEAERGVSVSVTTEDEAFLAMEPDSEYAEAVDNNEIRLNFGDNGEGSGVAPNSVYRFPQRIFEVVNQGTTSVGFTIDQIDQPDDDLFFTLTALGFDLQNATGSASVGDPVGPGAFIQTGEDPPESPEFEITVVAENPAEWVSDQSEFAVQDENGNIYTDPEGPYY